VKKLAEIGEKHRMIFYLAYSSVLKIEANVSTKHRALSELHGITTQKRIVCTVTSVGISNPTWLLLMIVVTVLPLFAEVAAFRHWI
jgi:hypothetical protein